MSYLRVRAVIFDVDGVLLDARASYHAAAEEAARRAVQEVLGRSDAPFDRVAEVPKFKAAGRFNDDWEMARGIAVLLHLRHTGKAPSLDDFLGRAQGRGVEGLAAAFLDVASHYPQAWLSRLCGALYGGRSRCRELFGFEAIEAIEDVPEEGFWERETKLVDPALLRRVTRDFPVGIYTGRNPGGLPFCILKLRGDGRPRKPDPTGLEFLCGKLVSKSGGSEALFVGDTADDEQAARAARARGAPLVYAHVAAPGDTTRVLERLLAETGA